MAVPSSGQLRLRDDIAEEVLGGTATQDVSLRTLSAAIGISSPDAMSEFYGYVDATAPTVTTGGAGRTNVLLNISGTVNSDGGAAITERGFYFGTSSNRASNPKYIIGGTTGGFSSSRTGLTANTTYYFWAYATNSVGTTYGAQASQATFPTLGYNWTYTNVGSGQYLWHTKLVKNDGTGVQANVRDQSYFYHPYLGVIGYDTTNTSYTQSQTGGTPCAQNYVGRLNVSGYSSTHVLDTFCTYSPTSWKTPVPATYGDPDIFIQFIHPSVTTTVSAQSHVTACSWTHYTSTGYNIPSYVQATQTSYFHNGGYMSQASMATSMTIAGG